MSAHSWVSTHICTTFQGVNEAACIQCYILGKHHAMWAEFLSAHGYLLGTLYGAFQALVA